MAEELAAAFPDLEEVFSAEEILAFWGEVGEGASSGAGPVSYTHLTLPTICSV